MDVIVGTITSAHGLRGDVMVQVRTDSPEDRFYPAAELRTDPAERGPLTIASVRVHKGQLMVRFDQCQDRNQAEALRGTHLVVDTEDVEPEEDAWYPHELKGLAVVGADAQEYGTVKDLIPGAAQDLLVVDTGKGEVLVPFVVEIVPTVDVQAGRVVLTPPGGMFDEDED
ncbi:MAG: ribosome maturation factor RimM [Actinomycetaceae bacterium]|nr:ribosome maturation factor RimM [Actinomycetaceae bacterium]